MDSSPSLESCDRRRRHRMLPHVSVHSRTYNKGFRKIPSTGDACQEVVADPSRELSQGICPERRDDKDIRPLTQLNVQHLRERYSAGGTANVSTAMECQALLMVVRHRKPPLGWPRTDLVPHRLPRTPLILVGVHRHVDRCHVVELLGAISRDYLHLYRCVRPEVAWEARRPRQLVTEKRYKNRESPCQVSRVLR